MRLGILGMDFFGFFGFGGFFAFFLTCKPELLGWIPLPSSRMGKGSICLIKQDLEIGKLLKQQANCYSPISAFAEMSICIS